LQNACHLLHGRDGGSIKGREIRCRSWFDEQYRPAQKHGRKATKNRGRSPRKRKGRPPVPKGGVRKKRSASLLPGETPEHPAHLNWDNKEKKTGPKAKDEKKDRLFLGGRRKEKLPDCTALKAGQEGLTKPQKERGGRLRGSGHQSKKESDSGGKI